MLRWPWAYIWRRATRTQGAASVRSIVAECTATIHSAMTRKLKLTYFDYRGIAEPIRYILAYADIAYEDIRVADEDWLKVKESFPFCALPVLEIEGEIVNQAHAIARYFAKQCELAGADDLEALQVDALADTVLDLRRAINDYYWHTKDDEKPQKKEKLEKETLPFFLGRFEKMLQDNNGYFVNGKLSYADLVFAGTVQYFSDIMQKETIEPYPLLKALVEKVNNIPRIKEWISKRPVTVY